MEVVEVKKHSEKHVEVVFINNKGYHIDYEVFLGDDGEHGMCRNGEDYAGIWVNDKNEVEDYDMVFELSESAKITLRESGVIVPEDL